MEKNNITKLFEDVNLYETKEIALLSDADENTKIIEDKNILAFYNYLGISNSDKLITDCIFCEGHFPFSFKYEVRDFDGTIYSHKIGTTLDGKNVYIEFHNPSYVKNKISTKSLQTKIMTIDYYFMCTNQPSSHQYYMKIAILFDKNSAYITKIGQFPENSSLGHFVSEEYKKELRKINDAYIDYKNSEKSFRHGLYVGAYDYLRRVYEKMINYYLDKNNVVLEANASAEKKIKSIKTSFDKRIQDFLYPIYSALSAGVHVMTEDECKENYSELKALIDIQLQFIKSESELTQQIDRSKAALDNLNKKYKK